MVKDTRYNSPSAQTVTLSGIQLVAGSSSPFATILNPEKSAGPGKRSIRYLASGVGEKLRAQGNKGEEAQRYKGLDALLP